MSNHNPLRFETLALHAGFNPYDHMNAGAVPIYQTSAYAYNSADHAANLFELKEFGNIYTRLTNPTTDILEKRIAAIEGGAAALVTSSGMAAQFLAIQNITECGDNILSSPHLYGGTFNQFYKTFKKIGIEIKTFDVGKPEMIAQLADEKTKAVYFESIGNPSMSVPDFKAISAAAHQVGVPVIVDNTFTTPYLVRPIEYGADIIVHSLTKYMGGHGTGIGGVIVDAGSFDWASNDRFPSLTKPHDGYHGMVFNDVFGKGSPFGNIAYIIKARVEGLRDFGPCASPFNSFLFIQGIETLALRMERNSQNAMALAQHLEKHPQVTLVNYPSLPSSKYHALAQQYLPKGAGGMFTFELNGGREVGRRFVESVKVALHETNLGDSRTIVTHNSSTTHQQLNDEEQVLSGVTPGMVRVSTGLEHIDDLIADFDQAIEKAVNPA